MCHLQYIDASLAKMLNCCQVSSSCLRSRNWTQDQLLHALSGNSHNFWIQHLPPYSVHQCVLLVLFCSVLFQITSDTCLLVFPWLTVCVAGHACTKQAGGIYGQHHFGVVAIVNHGMINVACTNSTGTSNKYNGYPQSQALKQRGHQEPGAYHCNMHYICSLSNLYTILMHFWISLLAEKHLAQL